MHSYSCPDSVTTLVGSQVMPLAALGFNYYAMSWWASVALQNTGEIAVVATADDTLVRFRILASKGIHDTYNGVPYDSDRPLTVRLDKHQTFQLQDVHHHDITGTKIEADKPVAVFSGLVQSNIGGGSSVDHVVDQLAPLHSWGTRFGVVPFPSQTSGYYVKVVALAADTRFTMNGRSYRIALAGDFKVMSL